MIFREPMASRNRTVSEFSTMPLQLASTFFATAPLLYSLVFGDLASDSAGKESNPARCIGIAVAPPQLISNYLLRLRY